MAVLQHLKRQPWLDSNKQPRQGTAANTSAKRAGRRQAHSRHLQDQNAGLRTVGQKQRALSAVGKESSRLLSTTEPIQV